MLTNNSYNDQKGKKTDTKERKSKNEASEATKLIPGPETIKISTKMLKHKRLNRMCLEKNPEQQPTSLERAQKELSNDIKKSKIGDRMLKIRLPECKIEHPALTTKIGNQTTSKPKNTYINVFISELAFWHIFWIEKLHLYAQVTEKKPTGPLEMQKKKN